jgi:hypothetical protein
LASKRACTLHFVFRGGEYTVGDKFKSEIDEKVKAVDSFLNALLTHPQFAEQGSPPNHRPFGTSVMAPTDAGATPRSKEW